MDVIEIIRAAGREARIKGEIHEVGVIRSTAANEHASPDLRAKAVAWLEGYDAPPGVVH
jgi:hypothetical protein